MEITEVRPGSGRYPLPDLVTVEPGRTSVASLSEKAYYLLRERLITLRIRPGETIDERALQEELEVGRTPLREALSKLADDRLVHVVARRGTFASHLDLGALSAISEVRVELESHAGYLAAKRATVEDHDAIAGVLEDLDARGTTGPDHRELIRLDLRIHHVVHRATHNPYLIATLDEYYVHSLRMWFFVLDDLDRLEHAIDGHRDLLTAVSDGDFAAAQQIMRDHVTGFEQEIRAVL
ncbi:DNA-binding GntR family transcriptional regulator [Saccharopolyspora lacisalsi]|uniref:DNA-binding GntR family transcriptional regulator n=1 Tax=Halosaccharopolyspora lacisalsi TaxID=1000566 RepID=A0A839E0L7_9PSEU|nr:GntR family transcriptional regulator [Halosaccharopolyspora lacisalsi]MBA8826459.1 DNA-binding GntR family transcriptional regulator [Halosaccharopolyspora lacisalsi]